MYFYNVKIQYMMVSLYSKLVNVFLKIGDMSIDVVRFG